MIYSRSLSGYDQYERNPRKRTHQKCVYIKKKEKEERELDRKSIAKCMAIALIFFVLVMGTPQLNLVTDSLAENLAPEPWIIEPSILNDEVPRHNDTVVIWGDHINVSAVELKYANDIENTTFEYSSNGINWNIIDIDYEGTKEWENWTDVYGTLFDSHKVWSAGWNTSGIVEGIYYVRATMINTLGQMGQNNITVYFDPIPPIPDFDIDWEATVNGTIQVSIDTNATDIVYTLFESFKPHSDCDVPIPRGTGGICMWDSIAALLMYWANQTKKDNPAEKPLHNLTKDDNGNEMTAPQLVDALVVEFNNRFKKSITKRDPLSMNEALCMLMAWLEKKGLYKPGWLDGLTYREAYWGLDFAILKKEFERFMKIENGKKKGKGCPILITISNRKAKSGHAMVVKSITNKPIEKDDKNPKNNIYRVEFMDPFKKGYRIAKMNGEGKILMDWNDDGTIDPNNKVGTKLVPDGWWEFDEKVGIVPSKDILTDLGFVSHWTPEGTDYNSSDGWSLVLNTTQLEEGYHFIRATMVDSTGNNGSQTTEVFVDNVPPILGDHDIAITSLTANETIITVTVENQGLYNETTYVSVYYERIDPIARVDLENGTTATLNLEWTPPSRGRYIITAEADQILDEIDTADNLLVTNITMGYGGNQASQLRTPNINWTILILCLLLAGYSVPIISKRNRPKFDILNLSATALKQYLSINTREHTWQQWGKREFI